jgi:PAT family beta-lactamase induction signal transducer AmpG
MNTESKVMQQPRAKSVPFLIHLLLSPKMLIVTLLGFSSGIPLALVTGTLQAWMASKSVDLTLIGIFSLVGLPYTLKFLWAPLMDRYVPPFLGRRRGWIVLTQLALILSLVLMSFCDPVQFPGVLATFACLVAFSSASQDIVFDAYKTEVLAQEEYGLGAASATLGYRVAMLFSGAFALILSDHLPWSRVYQIMALSIIVGVVVTLLAPEGLHAAKPPKTLREAVAQPFFDFLKRRKVTQLIAFIILYKIDVVVAVALMTPFMMELGFTKTDIGTVTKGFGLIATLVGTFAGGIWLSRIGVKKSLWTFGVLQGVSGLSFYFLAKVGYHYPMMVFTIAAENFFSGMGNAAYTAFLMSLCNPRYTATQFALVTSLMALTRTVASAPTGWLAKTVGWESYFLIAISLMIPGLMLLTRYDDWMSQRELMTE